MLQEYVLAADLTKVLYQDSRIEMYSQFGQLTMPVLYREADPEENRSKGHHMLVCYCIICKENEVRRKRQHYVLYLPLLYKKGYDGKLIIPDVQPSGVISKPLGSNRVHVKRLISSLISHRIGVLDFHEWIERRSAEWPPERQ